MASLFNTKISNTYVGLIKTIDNAVITATLKELTDGSGNATGLSINTGGDFKATGTIEWGSLKDTGENITITKFVDEADGIANNDNDTTIPTSAAIVDYVAARITLEDLDFSGDSGTGSVDLDSQVFAITGTANQIETTASGQGLSFAFPSAGIVLPNGSTATTQSAGDNSTKIATTAYVETAVDTVDTLAEILAIGNTTGGTNIAVSANDDITFTDTSKAIFGDGNDLQIYHTANSFIYNTTGDLILEQTVDDQDIVFKSDNGSGGTAEYLKLDGSIESLVASKDLLMAIDGNGGKIKFGASQDLSIYHDGSNSYIDETGTGSLYVRASDSVYITKADGSSSMAQFTAGGGSHLYFNNNLKLSTSSDGISVTGGVTATGSSVFTGATFSSNVDWADNAKARFGTGNDLLIDHDGSASNIVNENGALKIEQKADDGQIIFYNDDGSGGVTQYLNIHGTEEQVQFLKDSEHQDNVKARFGDAGDLQVYHDGSNSHIDDTGTGNLVLRGNGAVSIQKYTGENLGMFNADGSVDLYHDDTKKFETSSTGVTITGVAVADGLDMGDDEKIRLGDSQDLQLYHDGSHSYIKADNTGDLYIQSFSDDVVIQGADDVFIYTQGGEDAIIARGDGAVQLFYNAVKKLETKNGGIDVLGSLDASGTGNIDVSSTSSDNWASMTIQGSDTSSVYLFLKDTSGERARIQSTANNDIKFLTNGGGDLALELDSSTNASFSNNVTIAGDLTVNGTTTTVNTDHFNVEDPLISMAKDNAANTVDIGFYGRYNDGSNRYLGLFADASDSNRFKLFKGTTTEPTTTVDTSATGYEYANILLSSLESRGNITVNSSTNRSIILDYTSGSGTYSWMSFKQSGTEQFRVFGSYADNHLIFYNDQASINQIKLNSNGSTTFGGDITVSEASPSITLTDTDNTSDIVFSSVGGALTVNSASDQVYEIAGTEHMRLNASGLGVGTATGTAKLEVSGGSLASGTVTNIGMATALTTGRTRAYDSGTLGSISTRGDSTALELVAGSSAGYFTGIGLTSRGATAASGTLIGYTYGAERFRVDAGGDFGINVTNPVHKLHVGGDTKISHAGNGNAPILHVIDTADTEVAWFEGNRTSDTGAYIAIQHLPATAAETNRSGIKFQAKDDGDNTTTYAQITQYISDNTDTTEDGDLAFSTVVNGSLTENLRFSLGKATFYDDVTITGTTYVNNVQARTSAGLKVGNDDFSGFVQVADNGQVNFDSGNSEIHFLGSGTTFGKIFKSSDNFYINNPIQDKDIIFSGDDGGSSVTAMTLDMSNAGSATFNDDIDFGGKLTQTGTGTNTFAGDVTVSKSGARLKLIDGSDQLNIGQWDGSNHRIEGDANRPIAIQSYEGNINLGISGGNTMSVHSGDVTFEKDIIIHNTTNAPYIDFVESGATTDSKARITMDQIDTDNASLIFSTEGGGTLTNRMQIDKDGNVALGAGYNNTNAEKWQFLSKASSGGTCASSGGAGYFALGDGYSTNDAILMVRNDGDRGTVGHASGSPLFKAEYSDASAMEIDKNGITGIGATGTYTPAPSAGGAVLNLSNTGLAIKNDTVGNDNNWSVIKNTGTDSTANLEFVSGGGSAMTIQHNKDIDIGGTGIASCRLTVRGATDGTSDYIFEAANSSGASKFYIRNDGVVYANGGEQNNVAFGCTSAPDADTEGVMITGSNNGQLSSSGSATTAYNHWQFRNGNGMVGYISTSASATTYSTSSDYRMKEDLKDFNGLDLISKMNVYDFKWKSDKTRSYGAVAHEIQEIIPQAVTGEKDGENMQGVDYSQLVPVLLKSIQELKAEVDELKKNCNCK